MFRTAIRAAAIGCAFILAGCNQTISAPPAPTSLTVAAEVIATQSAAVRICGFEPAASTVVSLLGKLTGYSVFTDPATDVADRICAAVTKTASAEPMASYAALKRRKAKTSDAPKGEVDGVPIKGRFVAPPKR